MGHVDNILILALGNEILGDDGIALKLLSDLKKKIVTPSVAFKTSMTGGIEIVETLSAYKQVIILDSIKTMDGIPGTVYHYSPDDFNETTHISSFHDVSFLTALKFAECINMQIPKQIDIVAIEIVEDMLFTQNFSPEIRKSYPQLMKKVLEIILNMLPEVGYEILQSRKNMKLKELNLE